MLYLGVRADGLQNAPDHLQIVVDPEAALGEGNSVFLSASDREDLSRAPAGYRALTVSTHTAVEEWWRLFHTDPDGYAARKAAYTEKVLQAIERAIPGVRAAADLILPGTPVTFERFTRRPLGMVGGFPQTSLFRARGPETGIKNAWLVGDSVFPGQSTAGVTLGAIRVANEVIYRNK